MDCSREKEEWKLDGGQVDFSVHVGWGGAWCGHCLTHVVKEAESRAVVDGVQLLF
jgi:hypothetical protein